MDNQQLDNSLKGIAIIGMVGRFPGASNVDRFWQNLCEGRESISFFTDEELTASGITPAQLQNPNYIKAGSLLSDIEMFDASFFDISPKEAEIMDPQHRIFLECAWEALENAGYAPGNAPGLTGVYAGTNLSIYLLTKLGFNSDLIESLGPSILFNNSPDYVTTRVSYKLNLKGPSMNLGTACSTSLVAVHVACQGLLNYECDLALAGGISIQHLQKGGYFYQKEGMTSPDGHCRAFDADARGTIFGDGAGIVVLKRLEDAVADGDCIYAAIAGSAINNDGGGKISYTAPSASGQAEAIAEARAIAGFDAETIDYVEAHGTGTALGDPIEIGALKKVFEAGTDRKGFCAIGSVKTNVGHLNTAAGVTGLIKTVLALKHKQIPPSLHFERPNPEIDFANSPFYVNATLRDWNANGTPRRAGVSSFGVGGTNAHVVLEEAPNQPPSSPSRPWQLLLLSAKTTSALEMATANLATYLQQQPQVNLADVAHTLQLGRRRFPHRRMVVCRDVEDGASVLKSVEPERVFTHHQDPSHRPAVLMFSGQGSQYVNMGRELYEVEPTFRQQVDRCAQILLPHLGLDLRHLLYPKEEDSLSAAEKLQQTGISQPALFVVEYALAQLWGEWGVRPGATIGHSIGEYVAATVAGTFSLEDALSLVSQRGRLMQQMPPGRMVAVPLPEEGVRELLSSQLSVAAVNGASSCVVSGPAEAVEAWEQKLASIGVDCRHLHTSHAFHSQMMEPILEAFAQAVQKVSLQPPEIPFISNLTGTWITDAQATDPSYWVRHLRQTVRFSAGITELLKQPDRIFLEVGPGQTLATLTRRHLDPAAKQVAIASLRHPKEQQSDVAFLLNALGRLWMAGVEIDWSGFYTRERRYRLPLPTYPFERQRYWIDKSLPSSQPVNLDKKLAIADWFYIPSWKRSLRPDSSSSSRTESEEERWLIFVDEWEVGSQLINKLQQTGKQAIAVRVGERFVKQNEGVYAINPLNCHDCDALLEELIALGKPPQNIAYLWSLNTAGNNQTGEYLAFNSLLFFVQALDKQKISDRLQIWVVSNQIQEVNGEGTLDPQKATVLGLCKVIPQEYPNIACRNIDVVLPKSGTREEEKLIDQLLGELTALSSDLIVAYRDRYRWVQTVEPVRLESADEGKTPLRKGGTYLITGGLEGIGTVLADYLAQTLQAKLIFVENSAFPEKKDYSQWLETRDRDDEISRKIWKLQALEALGSDVSVVLANAANYDQMQASLAPEKIGQIHGVIHSAARSSENLLCSIQELGIIQLEQLDYNCREMAVLEKILLGRPLDFCIVFSSLSSVLGGWGFAADSASNLFVDTFTHQHNKTHSLPWLTVNWDRLQLEDITEEPEIARQVSLVELAIAPTEVVEVFKRILSRSEMTRVAVSTVDLKARSDRSFGHLADTKSSNRGDSSSRYSRPNLSNLYITPTNELEKQIAEMWQEILGIEQVGINDNFFELGGDSLIATQLISRLRATFPVNLPMRDLLLQKSTVAKQAEIIEELLLEKIEELSEAEVEVLLAEMGGK